MIQKMLCAAVAACALLLGFDPVQERGKEVFGRRCSGCHATDINKEGPALRGVHGRKAAGLPGFLYSEALKQSGIRWNDETLNQWLSDPEAMVPNNDMAFRLADAEERSRVISYLRSLEIDRHAAR